MKSVDRREQERLKTRAAILDATEALMREEGYAAVTSRRVAERAGLRSQLVHYHFGSMDELFQEAFRRNERAHFSRNLDVIKARNTLAELWRRSTDREGMDLVSEYVSAANHRKVLKEELVQTWARFTMLRTTIIAKYYDDHGVDPGEYNPKVLTFLMNSIGTTLATEASLGFTDGHDEIMAFMETLIKRMAAPPRKSATARPAGRAEKSGKRNEAAAPGEVADP